MVEKISLKSKNVQCGTWTWLYLQSPMRFTVTSACLCKNSDSFIDFLHWLHDNWGLYTIPPNGISSSCPTHSAYMPRLRNERFDSLCQLFNSISKQDVNRPSTKSVLERELNNCFEWKCVKSRMPSTCSRTHRPLPIWRLFFLVAGGCCGSTKRVTIVGGWAWAWWLVTDVQRLSLEVMTLNPMCESVETAQGVPLSVTGVAQCKIMKADELLYTASEQFLGKSVKEIKSTILQTLEGHLRAILGIHTIILD